jgi:hypothetical protein
MPSTRDISRLLEKGDFVVILLMFEATRASGKGRHPHHRRGMWYFVASLRRRGFAECGTVGGDKNYDTADFVAGCRERGCTPHVSQNNTCRRSAIDGRTTRHRGYRISVVKRRRIVELFGWIKTESASWNC